MENDRRRDRRNRDRLDRIHKDYLRFSKRIAIAMTIQAIATIAALVVIGYAIREQRSTDKEVKAIAVRADLRSERNRVRQQLAQERVCSQTSNIKVACRALFDRLSRGISDQQRYELACAILKQMRGPTAQEILRATKCEEEGGP